MEFVRDSLTGNYSNVPYTQYTLTKRPDGYFNVMHVTKGQLNDKRIRLGAAKELAESHLEANPETHREPAQEIKMIPDVAMAKETPVYMKSVNHATKEEPSIQEEPLEQFKLVSRSDEFILSSYDISLERRKKAWNSLTNPSNSEEGKPENWLFLGPLLAFIFADVVMKGGTLREAAVTVYEACPSPRSVRRVRKKFRKNGYKALGDMAHSNI